MLDRYAQQILTAIERDGFYVRVPAGKQFYLYVTQTLDQGDAKIGGNAVREAEPAAATSAGVPSPTASQAPTFRAATPPLRSVPSATSLSHR